LLSAIESKLISSEPGSISAASSADGRLHLDDDVSPARMRRERPSAIVAPALA